MATIINGVVVKNGEAQIVGDDTITYDTLVSGNSYWATSQCVTNGGKAYRTEVKTGHLKVSEGGYAQDAKINGEMQP